jgi:hypothetical protein
MRHVMQIGLVMCAMAMSACATAPRIPVPGEKVHEVHTLVCPAGQVAQTLEHVGRLDVALCVTEEHAAELEFQAFQRAHEAARGGK